MENDETKSNVTAGTSTPLSDQPIDKKKLFANLLKAQYPMAQDEPLQKQETTTDANKTYEQCMNELLEKHSNEW
jgi:hypothetical protein